MLRIWSGLHHFCYHHKSCKDIFCLWWTTALFELVNCLMNVTSSAAELLSLSIIVSKLEKVTHHWLSVVLWPALHCTGNWCRNAGPGGGGVMPHTVHPGSCTYTYTCTCPAMQLRHRTLYTLHIIQGSTCYGRFGHHANNQHKYK